MERGPNGAGWLATGVLLVLGSVPGCATRASPAPHVIAAAPGHGTEPSGSGPSSAAVSPVSYLDDEYEQIYPVRIKLRTLGDVGFRLPLSPRRSQAASTVYQPSDAPELVVIDEQDDALRVVSEESSTRLLLWLRASDTYQVVHSQVRLRAEPTGALDGDSGVWLMPGVAIGEIGDRAGGSIEIRYEDNCVEVGGWLAEDVLARAYQPAAEPEPPDDDNWLSPVDGAIYDRPGGKTIATIDCPVRRTGNDEGGLTPIVFRDGGVMVRGFAATQAAQGHLFGAGYGGFGGLGVKRRLRVPEGTCIRLEPGGPIVGRFTSDETLHDRGNEAETIARDGAGWRVPIETRWGVLPGYLREVGPVPAPPVAAAGGDNPTDKTSSLSLASKDVQHGPLEECR